MSTQFEQIVEGFIAGSLTLEAACQQLTSATQADPVRTRFWGQRVDGELRRGRIPAPAARAMLDALEGFQSDKTMWLDPSLGLSRSGPVASTPSTDRSPSGARAGAQERPMDRSPSGARAGAQERPMDRTPPVATAVATERNAQARPAIESMEALRATLFEPVAPASRTSSGASVVQKASEPASAIGLEPLPLGTIINGRYKLIAHQGAGGVGQVFDAIDLSQRFDADVTLKIVAVNLKHEPYAFDALKAAVERSRHLDHANIVRVYGIDQYQDRVFITMEPLRGRWLSGIVREVRRKGMAFEAAWPIIAGIANGLAYAHEQGVVHSDLSPHSVFVGDDGTAKIVGFGLVNAVPASNESLDVLDTLTLRAYTEAYTADAWAQQGTPHSADDLYPLGVMAYEMLTGVHPFQRCSLSVARQKGLTYPPIEGLNRRARRLIERCLSFDRDVRPKDGHTFVKRMQPSFIERLWVARTVGA